MRRHIKNAKRLDAAETILPNMKKRLKYAYSLAEIGFGTAGDGPPKVLPIGICRNLNVPFHLIEELVASVEEKGH